MKSVLIYSITFTLLFAFTACNSYRLPDDVRYEFTAQGPVTDDVFQVIVTAKPGIHTLTQHEQRESAFISAKSNVTEECINQIMKYYFSKKNISESSIQPDKLDILKNKFRQLASGAVIEQEYYMPDNSVVFVVRIYSSGIKNKILNY